MRVLIACEFSGVVRDEFRSRGHDAWSCDLRPGEGLNAHFHLQFDVRHALQKAPPPTSCKYVFSDDSPPWDLLIAHPPCTHLALSGARWLKDHWVKRKNGDRWHDGSSKRLNQVHAVDFFRLLLDCDIPRRCIENPMSMASRLVAPKTQTIHPWQFGHPEQKTTWLWLRGLPPLLPTNNVYEEMMKLPKSQRERIWSMPPGPEREKMRSVTFKGIASAMADQWGGK